MDFSIRTISYMLQVNDDLIVMVWSYVNLYAGLFILVLDASSASGHYGLCRKMRSSQSLMVTIMSQRGRRALKPLIGTSRSWMSSSRDTQLPPGNKKADGFVRVSVPAL